MRWLKCWLGYHRWFAILEVGAPVEVKRWHDGYKNNNRICVHCHKQVRNADKIRRMIAVASGVPEQEPGQLSLAEGANHD